MADLKVFHSQSVPQAPSRALTPYPHELNYSGTACASDCPACHWLKRTRDAPWSDEVWRSELDDSRYVAWALRLYWEHVGMIEGNFADLDAETQSSILQVAARLKNQSGAHRG